MQCLEIICKGCGCEDFRLSKKEADSILSCDGCGNRFVAPAFPYLDQKMDEGEGNRVEAAVYEGVHAGEAGEGWVYFIGPTNGPIKIGVTAGDPSHRVKGLQTGNPEKLAVIAKTRGGAALERAYHDIFSQNRLTGEWFKRTPQLEGLIKAYGGRLEPALGIGSNVDAFFPLPQRTEVSSPHQFRRPPLTAAEKQRAYRERQKAKS